MSLTEFFEILVKYVIPIFTFFGLVLLPKFHAIAKRDIASSVDKTISSHSKELESRIDKVEEISSASISEIKLQIAHVEGQMRSERERSQDLSRRFDQLETKIGERLDSMLKTIINLWRDNK